MAKDKRSAETVGLNNADLVSACDRLRRLQSYRDLSTICVIPTRTGMISHRVVQGLLGMATPMNQKFFRIFVEKCEVGDAYNTAVDMILSHPELSQWRYLMTVEDDNIVPCDALLKLYESIQNFDAVSGLYWVKGHPNNDIFSQPMIYGDPRVMPRNYVPQMPAPNAIIHCNGIGMGCALFKLEMFRKIAKPWFRTMQELVPGQGLRASTQDLYFCEKANAVGFKFAVDCRIRVGHLDLTTGTVW